MIAMTARPCAEPVACAPSRFATQAAALFDEVTMRVMHASGVPFLSSRLLGLVLAIGLLSSLGSPASAVSAPWRASATDEVLTQAPSGGQKEPGRPSEPAKPQEKNPLAPQDAEKPEKDGKEKQGDDPANGALAKPIPIELLDAGTGEKNLLRMKPKKGFKQTAVMELTNSSKMSFGGIAGPSQEMPARHIEMALEVTEVDAATGNFTYAFKLTKASVDDAEGVPPFVLQQLRDALASVVGLEGSAVTTTRGHTLKVDFKIPEDAHPEVRGNLDALRQSIAQLSQPLPEEPIGKGARWRTKDRVDMNGLKIDQSTTFELVDVLDGKHVIDVAIEQKAEPQDVEAPGIQGGSLRLEKLQGKGKGKTEIRLDGLVPHAKVDLEVDSRMSMTDGDQSHAVDMTFTSVVEIEPRP